MKPRPYNRTLFPMQDRAEPIRPAPLRPLPADEDGLVTIARRYGRFMARVEIALFTACILYMGTHLYFGLARQGLLPW